jgi:hypothetical protein
MAAAVFRRGNGLLASRSAWRGYKGPIEPECLELPMRFLLLVSLLLLAACRADKTPDLVTAPSAPPPPPSAPAAASSPEIAPAAPTPAETARKTAASPARTTASKAPRKATGAAAATGPCAALRGSALEACIEREARIASEDIPPASANDADDAEALRAFREAQAARDRELLERDAEEALAEEGRREQDDPRWRERDEPPFDPRDEDADAYADADPRDDRGVDDRYYEEDDLPPPPEDYPPEDEEILYEEPPEDDGFYEPRR